MTRRSRICSAGSAQRQEEIDRFWDVFIRPALNLPCDEAGADYGIFTVQTALLGDRHAGDLLLPVEPLGEMHGAAAGRALGDVVRLESRVESLDELDADAVILAVPAPEAARLLGEEPPALEDSPIVSVHLLFDRPILPHRLAALLDSPAHWVFDRARSPATNRRRRPVPDRRVERRPRAARDPGQGPGRPDGGQPDRPARPGGAALVARLPRAPRDLRRAPRDA